MPMSLYPRHTNSNHQEFPWTSHIHHSVGVFEDLQHHLPLCTWGRLALRMGTWMDDTIHIQVKFVRFLAIWVRTTCVYRNYLSIDFLGLFLDDGRYDLGIFGG